MLEKTINCAKRDLRFQQQPFPFDSRMIFNCMYDFYLAIAAIYLAILAIYPAILAIYPAILAIYPAILAIYPAIFAI